MKSILILIRLGIVALGACLILLLPSEYQKLTGLSYATFAIIFALFHVIFYRTRLRKNRIELRLLSAYLDFQISMIFVCPLLIWIDKNLEGDLDMLPQVVMAFLCYSAALKVYSKDQISWRLAILNGFNVGLSVTALWAISLFHIIDVRNADPESATTYMSVISTIILTPVDAVGIQILDREKENIAFLLFVFLAVVVGALWNLSN